MKIEEVLKELAPIDNCPALDGYHCWSNSLAKIYYHYGLPLAEEMLFGLGEGINFMYWEQKGAPPFIGGRGNMKGLPRISESEQASASTSSQRAAGERQKQRSYSKWKKKSR
jgi:hypothetical protein